MAKTRFETNFLGRAVALVAEYIDGIPKTAPIAPYRDKVGEVASVVLEDGHFSVGVLFGDRYFAFNLEDCGTIFYFADPLPSLDTFEAIGEKAAEVAARMEKTLQEVEEKTGLPREHFSEVDL